MGLYEIEKPFHNKKMATKLKRLPTEWERNICQLYIRQGTDNQNIQGAQKTKPPPKKLITQ
jgi:hypothetical protein